MYPCFFIEPIDIAQQALIVCEDGECPNFTCHRVEVQLPEFSCAPDEDLPHVDQEDPSLPWPTACACGYQLTDKQSRSSMASRKWIRKDTGEKHLHIRAFGIGAMWYATWWKGKKSEDGPQFYGWDWDDQTTPPLCVQTPGGTWNMDDRASNCTMKDDRLHRCWVRHGEPPNITVDKNGFTCGAGAGSIICGSYHGFLQNGQLT